MPKDMIEYLYIIDCIKSLFFQGDLVIMMRSTVACPPAKRKRTKLSLSADIDFIKSKFEIES